MSLNKISINDTTTVNTGIVYDITKATSQSYDSLSAALGTNGNNVPSEIREGGMTVRFVSNSDNKYVQYRLMSTSFSTNEADWQDASIIDTDRIADGAVTIEKLSENFRDITPSLENNTSADLDIADENNNSIVRFENGHIKTKEFDSEEAPSLENNTSADLDIADENNNSIVRFENGHIKTKEFDSEEAPSLEDRPAGDLDIADENNNTIVRFENGHIKTKEFDSEEAPSLENNTSADLDIADENNNSIVRFENGHIKTKNFDSRNAETNTDIKKYGKLKYKEQLNDSFIFNKVGLVGNWRKTIRDNNETISTYVTGAELLFKVKNTSSIKANFVIVNSVMSIAVSIDDGDFAMIEEPTEETVIAENLDIDYWHIIRIRTAFCQLSADPYHTKDCCLNFKNIIIDDGAEIVPLTVCNRKILFIGDSISAGNSGVFWQAYSYQLSEELNSQQIHSVLSGLGLLLGSRPYLPTAREMFEKLFDDEKSISIINEPDIVFIMIGTNDGDRVTGDDFQMEYEKLLLAIRNRFGGIPIFACSPFNGKHIDDTLAAALKFPNVYHIDTTNLKYTYTTIDGTHPDFYGARSCVNYILPYIFKVIPKTYFNNI